MRNKKIFLVISLLLIIIPFFINYYSIIRFLSVFLGIIILSFYLFDIKKNKILMLLFIMSIHLFCFSIDYVKTYTLKLQPIYAIKVTTNEDVDCLFNPLYRAFICNNDFYFDNLYNHKFMCHVDLLKDFSVNEFLVQENRLVNYQKKFVKLTGKISKITGTSSIELKGYTNADAKVNGYVKFIDKFKITLLLDDHTIDNYEVYDYIKFVGLVKEVDLENYEIIISDVIILDSLYELYDISVIESRVCNNKLLKLSANIYLYCLDNIYLDYKIDKYELSYALSSGKILLNDLISLGVEDTYNNYKVYKLNDLLITNCNDKYIISANKDNYKDLCILSD